MGTVVIVLYIIYANVIKENKKKKIKEKILDLNILALRGKNEHRV